MYLFNSNGKHIGTVSFFPDTLGEQNLLPPALSGEIIELRRLFAGFEQIRTDVAGGQASVFFNSPQDAGISVA